MDIKSCKISATKDKPASRAAWRCWLADAQAQTRRTFRVADAGAGQQPRLPPGRVSRHVHADDAWELPPSERGGAATRGAAADGAARHPQAAA